MEIEDIDFSSSFLGSGSFFLSPQQKMTVFYSGMKLKHENNLLNIWFWGKIFGIQNDYYVIYGLDVLTKIHMFYSIDCQNWGILQKVSNDTQNIAIFCSERFTGNPAHETISINPEIANILESEINNLIEKSSMPSFLTEHKDAEMEQELFEEESFIEKRYIENLKGLQASEGSAIQIDRVRIREEERLSGIVLHLLKCFVVPSKSYLPQGNFIKNPYFTGLSAEEARNLKFYHHIPMSNVLRNEEEKIEVAFMDIFRSIYEDDPKGGSAENYEIINVFKNMKRRNAETGKLRRTPLKRNKITDNFYGSLFIYMKFFSIWALVWFVDFILEFRFEYTWPFWLLMRTVHDSYKYQGVAFSAFFICLAVTSDMICFLFIPVYWLFLFASIYVWLQFVWQRDKEICLPKIFLWVVFIYTEISIRLKDLKNVQFHLDLCRPFAAHCIGYPLVTSGFGIKSYVTFKIRQKKQKYVQKENKYYVQLLQQALPVELQLQEQQAIATNIDKSDRICNGVIPNGIVTSSNHNVKSQCHSFNVNKKQSERESDCKSSFRVQNGVIPSETEFLEKRNSEVDDLDPDKKPVNNSSLPRLNSSRSGSAIISNKESQYCNMQKEKRTKNSKDMIPVSLKDEMMMRLELELRKLRSELSTSRQTENELRSQINSLQVSERTMRSELLQLQQDRDNLQSKQQDKQNISNLEKRLQEEKKNKNIAEAQMIAERKARHAEETRSIPSGRLECGESCRTKKRELDSELKQTRKELRYSEERIHQLECEVQVLLQYRDSHNQSNVLLTALSAMEDKAAFLENSLSAETRVKLDLFSALGEAKRELEIYQNLLHHKDKDIDGLKSKLAEVLAVMPGPPTHSPTISAPMSPVNFIYTSKLLSMSTNSKPVVAVSGSTLDPNASVYTPKNLISSDD